MKSKIRAGIGIAILLLGCMIFFYPNFREWRTGRKVDKIITAYSRETKEEASTSGEEMPFPNLHQKMTNYNQSLLAGQNITDAWTQEQQPFDFSTLESDDSIIGYIDIPDMSVRLPLYIGASMDNLAKGACVMAGTSMPIGGSDTNCVIAAHRGYRGSAYFRYIDRMEAGSLVTITTPWGVLMYQVTGTDIVGPSDRDAVAIRKGRDMVTLVSCHPYIIGGKRFIVYCDRVGGKEGTEYSDQPTSYVTTKTEDQAEMAVVETDSIAILEECLRIGFPLLLVLVTVLILFVKRNFR